MSFTPTTTNLQGPGTAGNVLYPSRAAYETHRWFSVTTLVLGTIGAAGGAAAGTMLHRAQTPPSTAVVAGTAAVGAALGIWLGNRTPPV
jgi:hypothetical protein